nr:putative ribonuclease H-like domain-containing protein [Tanacetum cinerariifolium]
IRSDNGTEFKNNDLNQFCGIMGIKREFSVPRTPQQNGIAERKNMTLIEATRTMLADSRLPIPFWAEAVNTAYPLGKFKGNVDEGFLVGYSNNDGDAAFDGKEHDFDEKKPESEVNVSPSSSAYNEVNAAGSIVPTVMKDSSNSSNTISAAGSSVSLTVLVKLASYTLGNFLGVIIVDGVYSLTRFEDLGEKRSVYWWLHLRLEDITYSDDEDDVGVNTPRSDKDRLELIELTVFLLPKVEKVRIGVNAVDLQVFAVRHKLLLFSLTNWCCSLSAVRSSKGVDCLPNVEIFIELARMGYEKPSTKLTFYKAFFSSQWKFLIHTILQCMSAKITSWNKFSYSMASAVICLSTGFSGVETPLFEGMLVEQEIEEVGDADEHVEDVTAGDDAHRDDSAAHGVVSTVQPPSSQPQPQPQPQHAADFPMSLLQEALNAYVALTRRVEHLEYEKVAQALEITKLKQRVKKLEKRNKVKVLKLRRLQRVRTSQRVDTSDDTMMDDESNQGRMIDVMDKDDDGRQAESQAEIYQIDMDHASKVLSMQEDETEPAEVQEVVDVVTTAKLITEVVTATSETVTAAIAATPSRRRKGVVIKDPEEESTTSTIIAAETKSKDKGKGILVEEPKPLKKKQQIERDEKYARELHAELNKNFNWNVAIDHEENRALQKINETLAERAAKRRKLDEEVEDLKRHLEIVPDEDDDVYTEATPLARKVLVVDYKIIKLNNKPHYKIIRADGTHQVYVSFLSLLRNFNREDLEALWSLVKERFSTGKPKNFSDDFLLTTFGAMFEKPNAHAQI